MKSQTGVVRSKITIMRMKIHFPGEKLSRSELFIAGFFCFGEDFDNLVAAIQQYPFTHQFSHPELRNNLTDIQLYGINFDKDTNWREVAEFVVCFLKQQHQFSKVSA